MQGQMNFFFQHQNFKKFVCHFILDISVTHRHIDAQADRPSYIAARHNKNRSKAHFFTENINVFVFCCHIKVENTW